jgi:hypothetical protein
MVSVVYQAARDEPNSSSVESGVRVPWFDVRLRPFTVGQIKREVAKIKLLDYHVALLHMA